MLRQVDKFTSFVKSTHFPLTQLLGLPSGFMFSTITELGCMVVH